MGFSLGDLGAFTKGFVDADTKATQERLKDRRAELQADRQLYIDMKTKKYESELKSFEAEDKKYKAIQAVKSQVGDDASKSEFGAAYLQETNPTLLYQMQKDFKDNPAALQDQLALYANANFKTTNTRDALDNKLKTDIDAITAGYKKALENARGDSKLVNAILGKRDKEIKLVIEQNKDGENGAVAAKEIATQGDTSNKTYEYGDEKEIQFRVPPKFIEKGNIVKLRENLNSSQNQKSYKDNAINTTVSVFKDNDFAKPSGFYQMNDKKEIIGFTGAGSKLNDHISMLWGGAVNSYTDETVYAATDGVATQASNVLRESNVNNTIKERITNYMHIEQPKKWFNDRENIVAIVPFSIVDVNNNIGNTEGQSFNISGKGNQKLVAEVYAEVLKEYTAKNNLRIIGEKDGQPEYGIIKPNRQFMNDIQTELLALNGKSSELSRDIQNRILEKLPIKDNKVDGSNDSSNKGSVDTITIKHNKSGKVTEVDDIQKNRDLLDGTEFSLVEENKKKKTKSTERIIEDIDEITADSINEQSTLEILTKAANSNNITDEQLLEFGDMVKLNKVPRTLRTRLFKLKMARQKKINDDRRKNFNEKVKNKNKKVSSIETSDENADV